LFAPSRPKTRLDPVKEYFVRIALPFVYLSALLVLTLAVQRAGARELDYLQTDPRFTGGEFNPTNPGQPNFWFYDQYAPARSVLQKAGVNMIPVTTLTLSAMTADSDAFYIPPPTNPAAGTYPLTNQEISVIQQYVATGRSIIFNLGGGISASMDNDLLSRLGLPGTQAADTISGDTNFPLPNQPIVGSMRSLVNVGDVSVIPYVEKADYGYHQGAYFFILDRTYLTNWNSETASQQNLFMNMVLYATDPWYQHYVPTASTINSLTIEPISVVLPEPGIALLGVVGGGMMMRRRRAPKI
jgi:hypothetical protein